MPGPVTISEESIARIMDAIASANRSIGLVGNQVSEIKGTVAAFASGLEQERQAREALGRKVDKHDEILRGDGTKDHPGLVEQIGDVREMAQSAVKGVNAIKVAIWAIGSPIAIGIILDVILRLLPVLYGHPAGN